MDERLKFIARLLDGEKMAAVPRVRHLTQDRLQDPHPLQRDRPGRLTDRSRRPYRHANQLPLQIETQIVKPIICLGKLVGDVLPRPRGLP
jgi:putative transposase